MSKITFKADFSINDVTITIADLEALADDVIGTGRSTKMPDYWDRDKVKILAAAFFCSPNIDIISKFLMIDRRQVKRIAYIMRKNGLWQGNAIYTDVFDDDEKFDRKLIIDVALHLLLVKGQVRVQVDGFDCESCKQTLPLIEFRWDKYKMEYANVCMNCQDFVPEKNAEAKEPHDQLFPPPEKQPLNFYDQWKANQNAKPTIDPAEAAMLKLYAEKEEKVNSIYNSEFHR